jgi:type IV pilus assembly protein PilE
MTKATEVAMQDQRGFSLIEMMITVAIIGILASIAVPQYNDYVTRSRLVEAQSKLSETRVRLEQYFVNNRTYAGFTCKQDAATGENFNIDCPVKPDATTFSITATGTDLGKMKGFAFSLNDLNQRSSTITATGWKAHDPNNCWVTRKPDQC